ncbi:MAG: hypothetical protein IKA57_01285 [Clostridia bacterium]|nr:hypothetical protein [Clostridia bacterium]
MSNLSVSKFAFRKYVECFLVAIFPYGLGFLACIIGLFLAPFGGGILFTLAYGGLFFFALFTMLKDAPYVIERYKREQEAAKNAKNKPKKDTSEKENLPEIEEPYFEDDKVALDEEDYDFYENNTFDPFLATLNDEERNEFSELFILKLKGEFPELPDYEVNGDNREFFLKFFIHLGIYRSDISSSLLAKIYQYSMKT